MAITGIPAFDGIAIVEVEANLLERNLRAKAAFIDTRKGATHGWTEANGTVWSEETKRALATLVECMERDLARIHLGLTPDGPAAELGVRIPSGLSEHLDGDNTKSI